MSLPRSRIKAWGMPTSSWQRFRINRPTERATVGPTVRLLGRLGPTVAALMVATWLGRDDLSRLMGRLFRWRVGRQPWVFAVLGPVTLLLVGLKVSALFGQSWPAGQTLLQVAEYPRLGRVALLLAEVVASTKIRGIGCFPESRVPLAKQVLEFVVEHPRPDLQQEMGPRGVQFFDERVKT